MTDQLPDDRAEQAARDWFAQQASGAVPGSIDPAAVRAASVRRQRLRLTGVLAAAAVLLAALAIVPMALRPADPPITGVPAPSATEPTWTTVAPSPLSPRSGSLTAWLNGQFYIIGGWDGGPCPPGAACDMAPPNLRDGARYDPATDTWTPIAEAPLGVGVLASNRGYFTMAATSDSIVVAGGENESRQVWSYQAATDSWQQRADLPADGQLVATATTVVLSSYGNSDPARYAHSGDSWTPLPTGPLDTCQSWRTLADPDRLVVLARCGEDGDEVRTSSFEPGTGEWSDPAVVPGITGEEAFHYVGGDPVLVAGKLVWPNWLSVTSSIHGRGIYDLETRTWLDASPNGGWGGLSFRGMQTEVVHPVFEAHSLVEANGHLLDVRDASWRKVPEAPVADRWDPVVAAGSDSLLSCFGYLYTSDFELGGFSDGCHLLTVGSTAPSGPTASATSPTALPTNPTGAPSTEPLAWHEVAPPDPEPRLEPLAVAAGGGYYLMGGHRPGTGGDDLQLEDGYRFDPASGAWTPIARLPQVALSRPYRMMADVVGQTVYVHFVFEELGELWAYDTAADSWRKLGDTGEGDYFVSTEDGLVKVLSDEGSSRLILLVDGQWVDLPGLPVGRRLFRLGDHQLGHLTADNRVAVLDTTTRSWQAPSEPGEVGSHDVYGVDGAAVFVYPPDSEGELMPNHKFGLNVVTLVDGAWLHPEPMLSDGGLGSAIGAIAGRWIVISGNLFDPRAQEWLPVPAIPGSDYQWVSLTVAGGPQGVLSCFPIRDIDEPEPRAVDSCYFLTVP
ncbi:MAG: hypothetical protein KIT69_07100 [Propionibacteriaceae bacterium]|nr:hypothetical protein [Propionibacteriaceae bacterium]